MIRQWLSPQESARRTRRVVGDTMEARRCIAEGVWCARVRVRCLVDSVSNFFAPDAVGDIDVEPMRYLVPLEVAADVQLNFETGALSGWRPPGLPVFLSIVAADGDDAATGPEISRRAPEWRFEVDGFSLDAYLKELRSSGEEIPASGGNRGGRPPAWRWDDAWPEVVRYVHQLGIPEPKAALIKHLETFFMDRVGQSPDESQLRKFVNRALSVAGNPL